MENYNKTPLDPNCVENEIDYFLKNVDAIGCCEKMVDDLNRRLLSTQDDYDFFSSLFTGKTIGGFVDNHFVKILNKKSNLMWRHGNDQTEVDMVCEQNHRVSFEMKTSSQERYDKYGSLVKIDIPFSKTNAGNMDGCSRKYKMDKYDYCLFMQYHMPKDFNDKFNILRVYVGMYRPSDLSTYDDGYQNCTSARLPVCIFRDQFRLIYGVPEP